MSGRTQVPEEEVVLEMDLVRGTQGQLDLLKRGRALRRGGKVLQAESTGCAKALGQDEPG
jgi:hypothetical protein